MRTNAIATAFANQRLTPVSVVREGRDDPLIHAILKTGGRPDAQNFIGFAALPPEGQSVPASREGDCEALWFQRHRLPCVI
jgi:hypothetical protein